MATAINDHATYTKEGEIPINGSTGYGANGGPQPTFRQQPAAWDYNGNPLAHANTGESVRYPAFAGYLQPGLYKEQKSNIANPAPLGLSAFGLTTFILSLLNFHTRNIAEPSIIIGPAIAYGGLVQLLAGMWEMAVGNTFGATALSSYGGFWISVGFILTPGFAIPSSYETPADFDQAFGFFLFGWFIFTFIMFILTLRSTVVFCALFFTLDIAFLMLSLSYTYVGSVHQVPLQKAGGMFGLLAAFLAWYVALAGIADDSNFFFTIPVWHFPWSDKARQAKQKTSEADV